MTVAELAERMSSVEYLHWQAFFRLEKKGTTPAGETPNGASDGDADVD